jgi:hypothetical protein
MSIVDVHDSRQSRDVFEYDPLSAPTSIRLLKVHPGKDGGHTNIELWEQVQTEAVPYRCLSYTWGDVSATTAIQANSRMMEVGNNLHAFLGVAAQRFPNEALWIDAICINQRDNTEKGHQVQRMGDIYKQASEVLVWLGDDKGVAEICDWICKDPTTWHKLRYYLPLQRMPRHLRGACQRFVDNSYWTRAWIMQELAFARSIKLLCSLSEVTPQLLSRCERGSFRNMVPKTSWSLVQEVALLLDMPFFGKQLPWEATAGPVLSFIKAMESVHPQYQAPAGIGPNSSIFGLRFYDKRCQEPRDRIYSLLSVANATDFEAKYDESNVHTFWRAANYFGAFTDSWPLFSLWTALELNASEYLAVTKAANGEPLQCSITVQASNFCSGIGCEYSDRRRKAGRQAPVATGDVLLCLGDDGDLFSRHESSPHFILRPDSTNEDSFALAIYLVQPSASRAIVLNDAEVLYGAEGVETRIFSWKQLTRAVEAAESSEGTKRFVLRLSPFYVVATLAFRKAYDLSITSDILRDFDIALDNIKVQLI